MLSISADESLLLNTFRHPLAEFVSVLQSYEFFYLENLINDKKYFDNVTNQCTTYNFAIFHDCQNRNWLNAVLER